LTRLCWNAIAEIAGLPLHFKLNFLKNHLELFDPWIQFWFTAFKKQKEKIMKRKSYLKYAHKLKEI